MTHEFTPDWKLSQQDQLQVHLSIALAKHVPDWPGATDEQLAAVAGDLSPAIAKAIDDEREACAQVALEVAATMSEGYQRSHCEHCRDGEIGCHNTGHHTAAAIRNRSQP